MLERRSVHTQQRSVAGGEEVTIHKIYIYIYIIYTYIYIIINIYILSNDNGCNVVKL